MIEVKDLTKKYGDFTAVQNLNFKIEDGEIVGFLGPNGAGKSTTMNMITGYIESTEGDIIVNGYDISKKPKKVKNNKSITIKKPNSSDKNGSQLFVQLKNQNTGAFSVLTVSLD